MAVDTERFRRLLESRKAELAALIDSAAADSAPVELDPQVQGRLSRMDSLQGQAMAQATAGRRRAELARIGAALARLDDGDFGYCTDCGEEIAAKRLELDPAVARCIDCAD